MKTKLLLIVIGIVFIGVSVITSPVSANRPTATPWDKFTATPTSTSTIIPTTIPSATNTNIPPTSTSMPPTSTLIIIPVNTILPPMTNTPTQTQITVDKAITPILALTSTPTETLTPSNDKQKERTPKPPLLPETGSYKPPYLWIISGVLGFILVILGFKMKRGNDA